MSYTEVKKRVDNGINLLNQTLPGWHKHIDIDSLLVSCPNRCILGQIGEKKFQTNMGFHEGLLSLGISIMEAFDYGFSAVSMPYCAMGIAFQTPNEEELVNQLWVEEILNLRQLEEEKVENLVDKLAMVC